MEPRCLDDKEGWGQAFILRSTDNEEERRGNISVEGVNLPGGKLGFDVKQLHGGRWFESTEIDKRARKRG